MSTKKQIKQTKSDEKNSFYFKFKIKAWSNLRIFSVYWVVKVSIILLSKGLNILSPYSVTLRKLLELQVECQQQKLSAEKLSSS